MNENYNVWVGGILDAENIPLYEAYRIASHWKEKGYEDVIVEKIIK